MCDHLYAAAHRVALMLLAHGLRACEGSGKDKEFAYVSKMLLRMDL